MSPATNEGEMRPAVSGDEVPTPAASSNGKPAAAGRRRLLPVLLFLLVWAVHTLSPVAQTGDSRLALATAVSVVRDGNLDLDEFSSVSDRPGRRDVYVHDGRTYWAFPWPSALIATPVVALLEPVRWIAPRVDVACIADGRTPWLEKPISSAVTATTVLLLFTYARRSLQRGTEAVRRRRALIAVLVFAFATGAWSTSSLAMWSHGPTMLCIVLALLGAQRLRRTDTRSDTGNGWLPGGRAAITAAGLGAAVAGAYIARPSTLVFALGAAAWMLATQRRWLPVALLGASTVLVPFLLVNLATYGSLVPEYYDTGRLRWLEDTPQILLGQLVSPSRGLLLFCPIVLVGVVTAAVRLFLRRITSLELVLLGVVVAHWLALGFFDHWWGGSSYGPRLFTDMLPLFFVLALPALDRSEADRRRWPQALMLVAAVWSGLVALQGATLRASWCWNVDPASVDADPDRLWDWSDAQLVAGYRALVDHPRSAFTARCPPPDHL